MGTEATATDDDRTIIHVNAKIGALERRIERLDQQIADGVGSPNAVQFMRAERSALKAGIQAMRWHRAEINGEDTPLLALAELVAVCDRFHPHPGAVDDVLDRARELIAEWGDGDD